MKFKLTDQQRQRIRWSNGKRGYVPGIRFAREFTRRGPREVAPLWEGCYVTETDAERALLALTERTFYARGTNRVLRAEAYVIFEVDPLGNVLRELEGIPA